MHSDELAISVQNITKTYRIFGHPGDRIKQAMTFGLHQYNKEFTAIRDVSFSICRGESVAIIGLNGSGKSTLLQLLCGILKPTAGTVAINGGIAALLELGAGFNPEFTGRENVYFQGALMGLRKEEMDQRFDDIASFADIGIFIEQQVRTYSTGMYIRLAFSVAIHVKPDILMVDEALSVGDMVFQHKSKKRIQQLVDTGSTLLLVSHDRNMVTSSCNRCILLNKGQMLMDGLSSDIFDYYLALMTAKGNEQIQQNHLESGRIQIKSGTGEARVKSIRLLDMDNKEANILDVGMPAVLEFIVHVHRPIPRLVLAFTIRDRLGHTILNTNTANLGERPKDVGPGAIFTFRFRFSANMGPGSYSVSTFLFSTDNRLTDNYDTCELSYFFKINNSTQPIFTGSLWLNPQLDVQVGGVR